MENVIGSLGSKFHSKDGDVDGSSLKTAKFIGIYFSAHWCPPCRNFTPVLAEFYKKVNASEKVLEIVFASSDSDEKSYREYLATMPWIALPLENDVKDSLSDAYHVNGIPKLVILRQNGTLITENGRGEVTSIGQGCIEKWGVEPKSFDTPLWLEIKNGKEIKSK